MYIFENLESIFKVTHAVRVDKKGVYNRTPGKYSKNWLKNAIKPTNKASLPGILTQPPGNEFVKASICISPTLLLS